MDQSPPKDRFHLVWIIFLLHGIGTLLPWNMFITANDYFVQYKFNVTTAGSDREEARTYGENYLAYTGLASKLPNIGLQMVNFFFTTKPGSINFRIFVSLLIQMVIFGLTIFLAQVDSSTWIGYFFALTMGSIVTINMANGIYQSCLFGLVANLPASYTNAIVTGMNISGTYSSLILILSLLVSPSQRTAAIFYFATAVVFLVICLLSHNCLIRNKSFIYYQNLSESNFNPNTLSTSEIEVESNFTIFRKIWRRTALPCVNIFLTYFVTLALFPGILSSIQPMDSLVPDKYFNPIVCFLSFNLTAVLGNLMAADKSPSADKIPSSWRQTIPIVTRFLLIPYFLLCNLNADSRTLPIYFNHDYYPILGTVILGLTQGYYTSRVQMYLPKSVEPQYASTAGMLSVFTIMIGILSGLSISPSLAHWTSIR